MAFTYHFHSLDQYIDQLRPRLRIAVVHGGDKDRDGAVIYKTHNPRSTKTYEPVAHDIAAALRGLGFQQVWVMPDDMGLAENLRKENIHLVWLNTGGVQGYNPVCHTAALLEMLGMPYIGHNPLNGSILDNKHAFKRELQGLGIPTAPFMICHPSQGRFKPHNNPIFDQTFPDYDGPFLVKPVSGRASLNILFADTLDQLPDAVAEIQKITRNTVFIEKYLPGREFCVSVCGYVTHAHGAFTKNHHPFTFSALERVLESDERIFTSMDHKAITHDRLRLLGAEDAKLKQELTELGRKIYRNFNLNSLVRIDLRCDRQGRLKILEANPKPDLKRPAGNTTSIATQGLSEYGMTYEDLIFTLFADRLDYLLSHHHRNIQHIVDLL